MLAKPNTKKDLKPQSIGKCHLIGVRNGINQLEQAMKWFETISHKNKFHYHNKCWLEHIQTHKKR